MRDIAALLSAKLSLRYYASADPTDLLAGSKSINADCEILFSVTIQHVTYAFTVLYFQFPKA